jgi:hypothetical protein
VIQHGNAHLLIEEAETAEDVPERNPDLEGEWFNWHEMAGFIRGDSLNTGVKRYITLMFEENRWAIWRVPAAGPFVSQSVLP